MSSAYVSVKLTKDSPSVRLAISTSPALTSPTFTSAVASANLVAKFEVAGLATNTQYYYAAEVAGVLRTAVTGKFKTPATAPGAAASFKFAFGSCAENESNHACFDRVRLQDILFFAHLGDMHYRDIAANDIRLFRQATDTQFRAPRQHRLYRDVPTLYMYDDHDYGPNNSDATSPSRAAALAFYRQRVPHPPLVNNGAADPLYYSFEVGRVVFIMTDLRSMASATSATDDASKSKMGAAQKAWFKAILADPANAGKFFVWFSVTPWVPNSTVGADHWGGYTTERREIADHIKANCLGRICILSGDTHAIGMDNGTNGDFATGGGGAVREFTASPFDQPPGTWPATYSGGYILNTGQFGMMEVVDTGASTITLNWTAMLHDGTILGTMSFNASL